MDRILNRLTRGFAGFRAEYYDRKREFFAPLALGQSPDTLVVSCSDSRVDPALLTGAAPGEIFVIRNVANLVPPYTPANGYHGVSSALEYAVKVLRVRHIIILGHSNCGGIRALVRAGEGNISGEFIGPWLDLARQAKETALRRNPGASEAELLRGCEQASIELTLDNLVTFPWVRERVEAGELALHGWYFDIAGCAMSRFDPAIGQFIELEQTV